MKKQYNHVVTVSFTVIAEQDNPSYISFTKLQSALLRRLVELEQERKISNSWAEAFEFHDVYEDESVA